MIGTIIIPHLNSNSFRTRNLSFTVNYYLETMTEFFVIVTEQSGDGSCPVSIDSKYADRFLHINTTIDSDLFNKTTLINNAVKASVGDVLVMVDNDCILPSSAIYNAIHLIHNHGYSVVMPFSYINYLTETQTRQYIREGTFTQYNCGDIMPIKKYTGGVNVFMRSSFDAVGGFDDEIIGWGSEDDAFLCKMKRIVGELYWFTTSTTLLHLWHPKANTQDYLSSDAYSYNRKRSACIQRMSDVDLHDYIMTKATDNMKLDKLVAKYESSGQLHIYCKVNVGSVVLTIDSTTYPVTFNSFGEVTFQNFCESFLRDGSEHDLVSTLNRLKGTIISLSDSERVILSKFISENVLTVLEV